MASISQALTALGLPIRAAFLLPAAILWMIFAPTIQIGVFIYARVISLPLQIAVWVSQGDMPGGQVTSLATDHLLQLKALSAPWGLIRSVSERFAAFGLIYAFALYYGFLLTMVVLMPVYITLNWALKPLWRGFRDWKALRTMMAERARHFVVSVSGFLVDLQYEYLQDEWRDDTTSTPSPRRRLFLVLDFVREQVWLTTLASNISDLTRALVHHCTITTERFLRKTLESHRAPSLVKTPLSAFIVIAVLAEDGLRRRVAQAWVAIFTDPASNLVTEVHDTEQGSKREQNQTIYEPLDSPKDMIRVLRILPGIGGQALECSVHAEQRSSAKYEALSYVWGDPTLQRFITLNGKRYAIGKNLYDCLVHLRKPTTERELWVDTLCINQADSEERSQQVLLMGDLYKRAEVVIVWLGLEVKGAGKLFGQAIGDSEAGSDVGEQARSRPLDSGDSQAIQYLLCSPWWSRVWTVQELILGSSVTVQCGRHSLPWESFCQVIHRRTLEIDPAGLDKTFYPQYRALRRERQLYRQHFARRYPLLERTYIFRGKQASLTVDKMFGFYGLLDDPAAEIRPEYVLHPSIVEESFAIDFINRYKSLAVMAIAELSMPEDKKGARWEWYPRWKRDGSTSARTLFWTGLGDEIGGQPWSEDVFDACSGRLVRAECSKVGHPYDYAIALEGWHADDVVLVTPVMTSQNLDGGGWNSMLEQWLSMVCAPDDTTDGDRRHSRLREFYKTITAGNFDQQQAAGSPQYWKYVDIVKHACRCRRLFLTASGRCGLGPQDTACGDEVWVLLGMAVPVVLGQRVASFSHDSDRYRRKEVRPDEPFRYLGQAYIEELARPGTVSNSGAGLSEEALKMARIWSKGI